MLNLYSCENETSAQPESLSALSSQALELVRLAARNVAWFESIVAVYKENPAQAWELLEAQVAANLTEKDRRFLLLLLELFWSADTLTITLGNDPVIWGESTTGLPPEYWQPWV